MASADLFCHEYTHIWQCFVAVTKIHRDLKLVHRLEILNCCMFGMLEKLVYYSPSGSSRTGGFNEGKLDTLIAVSLPSLGDKY